MGVRGAVLSGGTGCGEGRISWRRLCLPVACTSLPAQGPLVSHLEMLQKRPPTCSSAAPPDPPAWTEWFHVQGQWSKDPHDSTGAARCQGLGRLRHCGPDTTVRLWPLSPASPGAERLAPGGTSIQSCWTEMGPSSLALRPLPRGWARHKGLSREPSAALTRSLARPQTRPASTWLLAPPSPASTSALSLAQRTELGGGGGSVRA